MNNHFRKLSLAVALSFGVSISSFAAQAHPHRAPQVVQLAPIVVTPADAVSASDRAGASGVTQLATIYVTPADTEEARKARLAAAHPKAKGFSLMAVLKKIRTLVFG